MKNALTSSQFAYIDIKTGRKKLLKALKNGQFEVPVKLCGKIIDAFSGDDGTSILFTIELDNFNLCNRKKKK